MAKRGMTARRLDDAPLSVSSIMLGEPEDVLVAAAEARLAAWTPFVDSQSDDSFAASLSSALPEFGAEGRDAPEPTARAS
jgi:hypothetical protein